MKLSVNQALLRAMNYSHSSLIAEDKGLGWLDKTSIVKCEDVFVFDRFIPAGNLSRPIGDDETGLECSLNHFHLDCDDIGSAFGLAIAIFEKVSRLWRSSLEAQVGVIRQIASIAPSSLDSGKYELTYRFHVVRDGQSWLAPDLDEYEELLVVSE
jgi:hypothetical protein